MSSATKRPLSSSGTPASVKRPATVIDLTEDAPHYALSRGNSGALAVQDTSGLPLEERNARKQLWARYWSYKVVQFHATQRAYTILGQRNLEEILKHKIDALEVHRKRLFDRKFSYTMTEYSEFDHNWIIDYVRDKMGEIKDPTPVRKDLIHQLIATNLPDNVAIFQSWSSKGALKAIEDLIDETMDEPTLKTCLYTGTPDAFREFVKQTLDNVFKRGPQTPLHQDVKPESPSKASSAKTPAIKLAPIFQRQTLKATPAAHQAADGAVPAAANTPSKSQPAIAPRPAPPAAPASTPTAAAPVRPNLATPTLDQEAATRQLVKEVSFLLTKDAVSIDKATKCFRLLIERYKKNMKPQANVRHRLDLMAPDGRPKCLFNSFVINTRDHELTTFLQLPDVVLRAVAVQPTDELLAQAMRRLDRIKDERNAIAAIKKFNSELHLAYDAAQGALRVNATTANAVLHEEAKQNLARFAHQITAPALAALGSDYINSFLTGTLGSKRAMALTWFPHLFRPAVQRPAPPPLPVVFPGLPAGMADMELEPWATRSRGGALPLNETPEDFNAFLNDLEGDEFVGDTDEGVRAAAERLKLEATAGHKYKLEGLRNCDLLPHQVIGVDFMVRREDKHEMKDNDMRPNRVRGGLLADAMGLGKTVQCIATMVHNHPKLNPALRAETKRRATLIICPVALIHQWKREIETKAPGLFKVGVHHGATKMRTLNEFKSFDVIITSYGTMAREYPLKKWNKRPSQDEIEADQERIERQKGNLFRIKWLRLILDEAHTIKNPGSNVSLAASNLGAQRNWCLTGTPLQNKLEDIYPIFRVLRVPNVCIRASFREKFLKGVSARVGPARLRVTLAPYLMRRTENDKIGDRPILSLPTKHVEMPALVFSEDERKLYSEVENSMRCEVNRALVEGTAVKQINHFLIMLLRLRQLCIHPFLILEHLSARGDFNEDDFLDAAYNPGASRTAGTMAEQVARGLAFAGVDEDTVMCGICHVDPQEPQFATGCGHVFCLVCVEDTEDIVDEESLCPVCSKTLGKLVNYDETKHTAAQTIDDVNDDKTIAMRPALTPKKYQSPRKTTVNTPLKPKAGPYASDDAVTPLKRRAVPKLDVDSDLSDTEMTDLGQLFRASSSAAHSAVKPEQKADLKSTPEAHSSPRKAGGMDIKQDVKDVKFMTDKDVKLLEAMQRKPRIIPGMDDRIGCPPVDPKQLVEAVMPDPDDCDPERRAQLLPPSKEEREREARSWEEIMKLEFLPSTKMTAIEAQLELYIQQNDDKIIIFSQFVRAIDLLEKVCDLNDWPSLRYQGDMSVRQREAALREFEDPDGPRILLMSLKAGGVGLNLVCANKVILIDFWWNAAVEHQAIARCHRLGQNKEVFVQRFFIPGTVEERIVALQEAKLKTAGTVLGEAEGGGRVPRLSLRDIMGLFGTMERNEDGVMQLAAH
ncbi:SNF2 family N-terminal domain-domain-containing protein [Protomyces lactucae-debilis]|uniref:SNF2 family N-terminal domain-domain-containing protein n=1 Tax=Protomyces lactucae-debilis TaxID=2754530 RepID=A0A1Y2FFW9_PROLT|nr:SNF2 family N-terminal domain-containing protein [Protomyces lactucae-debilis]ORY82507.1 SNF2 family N-terminal domain-domain-containing protein [Protomyces lactucae-debilis]